MCHKDGAHKVQQIILLLVIHQLQYLNQINSEMNEKFSISTFEK